MNTRRPAGPAKLLPAHYIRGQGRLQWLGGRLYDVYGTYDVVWWLAVLLGVLAAIVHMPIVEKAVERPAVA